MNQAQDIDSYIAGFPPDTQKLLEQVRQVIRKAAPTAEETINYGIPTFTLNGNLVHFAGFKKHIGFYPAPSGIAAFKKELAAYKGAKGSVQFPIDQPLPLELIGKIVLFRVSENLEKSGNFLSQLSAPARRALENKGIQTPEELSAFSEAEILELHGMGPGSLPKLRKALKMRGLSFKANR